ARDRATAGRRAGDFRAARRRGLQAPRDCRDARHRERYLEAAAAPGKDVDAEVPARGMTVHDEWTDKLSEYLDGELSEDERRAVEAHLHGCADCSLVLADLKRVIARAQQAGAVARPPSADLWSGIAAHIDAGRSTTERSAKAVAGRSANLTPFTAKAGRRFAFTLP